jgi:hypothetical protein
MQATDRESTGGASSGAAPCDARSLLPIPLPSGGLPARTVWPREPDSTGRLRLVHALAGVPVSLDLLGKSFGCIRCSAHSCIYCVPRFAYAWAFVRAFRACAFRGLMPCICAAGCMRVFHSCYVLACACASLRLRTDMCSQGHTLACLCLRAFAVAWDFVCVGLVFDVRSASSIGHTTITDA